MPNRAPRPAPRPALAGIDAARAETRRKLIGAVHGAAKRIGLADDDRKAVQLDATGKSSLTDMTNAEIGQVLDRLNRDRGSDAARPGTHRAHIAPAPRAHIAKVRALWWTLYWLGDVAKPDDAALDAFVQRQTGLSSIRFLDHRHAPSVIEALKAMASRAGVAWPLPSETARIATGDPGFTAAQHDRHRVLDAIWKRLDARGLARAIVYHNYLESALKLGINHWRWSDRDLDAGIRMLGKKLRAAMARAAV